MVVVWVRLPDTPLTVTVVDPVPAVVPAFRVSVLLPVVGFVLNDAVTPFGKPEADRVTRPVKPFSGFTVMVLVTLWPRATRKEFDEVERLKSGTGAGLMVRVIDVV